MRVVLGWKPIYLDPTRFDAIQNQEIELIIGNGYTLNLDKLFHLPGRKNDTHVKVKLGINLTNAISKSLAPSTFGRPAARLPGSDADNLVMSRMKDRLKDSSDEATRLKKQNEQLQQLLQNNAEKERQNHSPPPAQSLQTSFMQPQAVIHSSMSPDFEKQYLMKMDKLLETITDLQKKQLNAPTLNQASPMSPVQQGGNAFDRLKQERENNFQKLGPVNYDAQANQIRNRMLGEVGIRQSDTMNRVDRAGYIEAGVKGLIDPYGMSDPALANLNLKAEFDDPKKISTLTFQFLGLKYIPPNGDLNHFNFKIPDRVFLTFDFFTYPTFRTKNLTYMNTNFDELHSQPAAYLDKQLILINEDFVKGGGSIKEPMYFFEVDPLKEGTSEIYNQLIEYLATKELVIDIWDGDSLINFGRARVRLYNLLRQGKDAEMFSPTLEIWDELSKCMRGTLQMTLKNQAIMMDSRSAACPPEITHFHFNRANRSGKHKVKSFKPLDIKKELATGFDASRAVSEAELMDEEYRKKLRIDRFKIMRSQLPAGPVTDPKTTTDMQTFNQSLREVEAIRERKKPEVIANALTKGYSDQHTISSIFGHPKFVTYKFENVSKQVMDFKILIEYGKNCGRNEFTLVRNPREWEYLAYSMKLEKPSQWDMLEALDTFSLGPSETLTLIFKFLSTDENALKNDKSLDKIASINITDVMGQVLCGLAFDFRVRSPIIDRTLSFYEMENRVTSLDLPQFYNVVGASYPRPSVDFSNSTVVMEWVDSNSAKLKVKVPPAPAVTTFYMFVYEDEHRIRLLGLYRIVIHAQAGIDISCAMGQLLPLKLTLESSIRRMAKIYTDNPRILTFDEQYQQQFELFPGSYNYVTYKLRSFKPAIEKVRINCVDNFSKELVQGWTIQVHTNPIVPNQTFPVHLQLHKNEILPPLPFDNKLDMPVTYEIESADPDIVQVIERFVKIDANSRNFIKLRALGQNKTGQREAYVYISSSEGAAGECWKLMLTISP